MWKKKIRRKKKNFSASNCPICRMGLLELSKWVLAKSRGKTVIYITNQLFSLSRSSNGQLKVKQNCCLKSTQLNLFYLHSVMVPMVVISDLFYVSPQFLAIIYCTNYVQTSSNVMSTICHYVQQTDSLEACFHGNWVKSWCLVSMS